MRRAAAPAYRILVPAVRRLNGYARRVTAALHLLQFKLEGALRPDAEWFDHNLDAYWQWPRRGRSSFLERGVLSGLSIGADARVLELCSGDGFNARYFYAPRAASVVCVDANAEAVAHAARVNGAANIRHIQADIRRGLPDGPFDNVIWDGALSHFTPAETRAILAEIAGALRPGGLLSGHTDFEAGSAYRYLRQQFPNRHAVIAALAPGFAYVYVLETREPGRANYYFFCSDDAEAVPFLAPGRAASLHAPDDEGRGVTPAA